MSMTRSSALFVLSLTLAASFLPAQTAGSLPGVAARALVTTEARRDGQPGPLRQEDIQVLEGNTRDQVTGLLHMQGAHPSLDFLILLDDGAGVGLSSHLSEIREFINAQPESTAIAVGYMRNGTVQYASQFTNDHAQASKALRIPLGQAGISGSPYFSLSEAIKNWRGTGAERREVLMVSDGIDRYGFGTGLDDPYVNTAISDSQKAGIVVFSIYSHGSGHLGHSLWRNTWGQNFLSQVSDETGGESYYMGFGDPVSFKPYLDDITARLNGRQYLLTFLAKAEDKAGLRAVKIRTEVPKTDLAAPDRVWVPAGK